MKIREFLKETLFLLIERVKKDESIPKDEKAVVVMLKLTGLILRKIKNDPSAKKQLKESGEFGFAAGYIALFLIENLLEEEEE